MGATLSKGAYFPPELTNEMINLVKGKSSLAKLSGARPIPFNGATLFTFSLDQEADLVAENGAKSNGGATIGQVSMQPVKIEYGMRVSDEFRFAADEVRLQYLQAFAEGFAAKTARALDIMAFHGVNPRSKNEASALTNKNFDDLVTQKVTYSSSAPQDNVEAAIALVNGNELDVTGMAMAPAFKSALAAVKSGTNLNTPLFPELGWGNEVSNLNGLAVDTNSTVSFNSNADRAIVGDFANAFRWGIAKEIPIEVIEYGNPDNSDAGDLKGHNQVYIRGEAYLGWAILIPKAFALIAAGASA